VPGDLPVSQKRDEVPLVERLAAAGLRLGEYRAVRNGGVFCTPLKQLLRRTHPNTGQGLDFRTV